MRVFTIWLLLCAVAAAEQIPELAIYRRDPSLTPEKQLAKLKPVERERLAESLKRLAYSADSGDYHRIYEWDYLHSAWLPPHQQHTVDLHYLRKWLVEQTAIQVEAEKMTKTWKEYLDTANDSLAKVDAKIAKAGGKWPPKPLSLERDKALAQQKRAQVELQKAENRAFDAKRKVEGYAERISEHQAALTALGN
jgi:hypothetical protein